MSYRVHKHPEVAYPCDEKTGELVGKCRIEVHTVEGHEEEREEHKTRVEKLVELLAARVLHHDRNEQNDRTVVFCPDDYRTVRAVGSLFPHRVESSVFTALILDDEFVSGREWDGLMRGTSLVAMCSSNTNVFERACLPMAKHYIFFEMPLKSWRLEGLLCQINKLAGLHGELVHVDVIYSRFDSPSDVRHIQKAMKTCGQQPLPWIDAFLEEHFPSFECPFEKLHRERRAARELKRKASTSSNDTSSSSPEDVKRQKYDDSDDDDDDYWHVIV